MGSVDADEDPKREAGGRKEEADTDDEDPNDPEAELELPAPSGTPPTGRVEVVANWNRTLTRSRGCMTRVAIVPAPRPATA